MQPTVESSDVYIFLNKILFVQETENKWAKCSRSKKKQLNKAKRNLGGVYGNHGVCIGSGKVEFCLMGSEKRGEHFLLRKR